MISKRGKKVILASLFEMFILILMIISVAFVLGENMELVKADEIITNPITAGASDTYKPSDTRSGASSAAPPVTPTPTYTGRTAKAIAKSAENAEALAKLREELTKQTKKSEESGKIIAELTPKLKELDDGGIKKLAGARVDHDIAEKEINRLNKEISKLEDKSSTTAEAAGAGKAALPGFLGQMGLKESWGGHLLAGVIYAAAAYGALEFFVNMIGLKDEQKKSVQYGVSSIVGTYQLIKAIQSTEWGKASKIFSEKGLIGGHAGFISVGIGVAIFLATYKKEKVELVTFTALPWQPPTGGRYCEECNKDPFRPCSEYRCKSLGQACELLNKGSDQEKCVWVNPGDVNSPIITPWKNALSPDELQFTNHQSRPPSRGTKIIHTKTTDKCLPAFTKLQFGITTNEPAQCKIDLQIKSFEEMQYYVGGTNFFKLNHTQVFRLPAPEANTTDYAPILQPDGTFTYFIKCMDANGNKNDDDFAISFCVDESPDTTPPLIENSSILSGSPVTSGIDNLTIEIYVNEPSECKWSIADKGYDDMEHAMTCATQSNQINAELTYTCSSLLTGIINQQQNKFYFRCKDKPASPANERNVMAQSFELNLLGTQGLNIIDTSPNETIKGASSTIKMDLEVETDDGAEQGKALCMFSGTNLQDSYIPMFETNSHLHKQTLELTAGTYTYYFICIDAGGNSANSSTTFSVETDKTAPIVVRTYKEQPDALKVVTNEDAKCTYSLTSCNFIFTDGQVMLNSPPSDKTNHYAKWESGKVYFIKCKDEFGNEPSPNGCSIIAGATEV